MSDLKKQIESLSKLFLNRDNELLVWAEQTDNPKLLDHVASILVRAANVLQSVEVAVDKKLEFEMAVEADSIHPADIDGLAALSAEFDASDDEFLQKQAAVIDQLLINFAERGLRAQAESAEEKELAKLRAKYRAESSEECYKGPRKDLERDIKAADAIKAIKSQVKEYRPLQASLSTRYCPDHPGSQVRRIGDNIYQCALDKKIYNYREGFTTERGNKVPGTDVANQTQSLGDRALEGMSFSTRENRLNANASEKTDLTKIAQVNPLDEEIKTTVMLVNSYYKNKGKTSKAYTLKEWDSGAMDTSMQVSTLVKPTGDVVAVLSYTKEGFKDASGKEIGYQDIVNGLATYIRDGLQDRASKGGYIKIENIESGDGAQARY